MSRATTPLAVRLQRKLERDDQGCLLWTGSIRGGGYGQIAVTRGKPQYVHIVAWELVHGPKPEGTHIDHQCHNLDPSCAGGSSCKHRRCCEVSHLELVVPKKNAERGAGSFNHKGLCKSGKHEINSEDDILVWGDGRRRCKWCEQERQARNYQRRKAL